MGGLVSLFRSKPVGEIQRPVESAADLKRKAARELGMDTSLYNFGVSGHTKTGKSSLINAILCDDGAAKTGEFETTHKVTKYNVPSITNVCVWDIPGAGTQTHNAKDYFKEKQLFVFDCLIILLQDTITEEEISFAREAVNAGQPIIFARSRCDATLDNMKKMRKIKKVDQDSADDFVEQMAIKFAQELHNTNDRRIENIKLFFISSCVVRDLMEKEVPEYHFQEREFINELKVASASSRGKN